jgi:lysophospholipase L1-like esterase
MKLRSCLLAFMFCGLIALHADPVFKNGDTYALCGDSITQQGIYSTFIEDYLLMCQPVSGIKPIQCGWGGTSAPHFAEHMKDTVLPFAPDVVTICFGMNDGEFSVTTPEIEKAYRDGLTRAVENFQKKGTRVIIIGSPGAVDAFYFKNPHDPKVTAVIYNQTLARLGEIASEVAKDKGVLFADLHGPMMDAMTKVKAARGDRLSVCGEMDGVHATPNGHLIMAYAFLKAMGFDGNIGTITYDAVSGQATATEGHRIVSSKVGEITLESSRYPYCYKVGDNHPFGPTTSILPFLPFSQDLNRYMLVVKNLKKPNAKVTWGSTSKQFTAAELAKGINLAAEFLDNPFVAPFQGVHQAVNDQQSFQCLFVTDYLGNRQPQLLQQLPEKATTMKSVEAGFHEISDALTQKAADAVKPVTHSIQIEEVP